MNDVPKEIYSNPLFDEEIISDKVDASIISSPKIDSLLEQFFSELAHIDLIPPGINEAEFDPEEEIDILHGPDDSIPPGIESDDFDSEDDDNSTFLPEFESFPVDYPDSGDSTIDVVEDMTRISLIVKTPRIFEASRARGFVLRSLELQILSFILGIQYPNLID
ncbi:hypothetical protein Tco_1105390 [Tanacetum coccineum]